MTQESRTLLLALVTISYILAIYASIEVV